MTSLSGKKIILGVTGSIAAYKSAFLVRLLVKAGAEVQVLTTPAANAFVAPLTFSTLSRRPVLSDVVSDAGWNNHVELGLWADVFLIAPATATSIARLTSGMADTMIGAVYLSARCSVIAAPAMDVDMWRHPAVRRNIQTLESDGVKFIPVGFGELASGLTGEGRMAEPEEIVQYLTAFFDDTQSGSVLPLSLQGKKVLVTAGPTYEAIDPVRFIGNRSSGKMGVAIAEALAEAGAQVSLILGPSALAVQHSMVNVIRVESAQEMFDAATGLFDSMDGAILAAAVADYRPEKAATDKIKKKDATLTLTLERTPDIAARLGADKKKEQVLAGFALETANERENALEKLNRKNFDFIVLNSLRDPGAGFNYDTNKISIIFDAEHTIDLPLQSKRAAAREIVGAFIEKMGSKL